MSDWQLILILLLGIWILNGFSVSGPVYVTSPVVTAAEATVAADDPMIALYKETHLDPRYDN
jgi:hypothetical protein